MAATGNSAWRMGGAAPSGFVHGINAYCYRCPFGLEYPTCNVRCAKDMEEMIKTSTSGRVAAFVAEPIQGVGGFIVPPKEYFEIVQGIVKKAGGLFISDEVQTGWVAPAEVVRHRAMGRAAGYHHQREGPREWRTGRSDGREAGSRRCDEGGDDFDVWRKSGDSDAGEGSDRFYRRKTS